METSIYKFHRKTADRIALIKTNFPENDSSQVVGSKWVWKGGCLRYHYFCSFTFLLNVVEFRDPVAGVCGLENLGNTCFVNAGLQCLFSVTSFRRFFLGSSCLIPLFKQTFPFSVFITANLPKFNFIIYILGGGHKTVTRKGQKENQVSIKNNDCTEFRG